MLKTCLWLEPVAGPLILIMGVMIAETIPKVKSGKTPGPSGIMAALLRASVAVNGAMLTKQANAIIAEGRIRMHWNISFIINLYNGKGDATDRGNYRGLKMTEHCLKVIERIPDKVIQENQIEDIVEFQFGFVPGTETTSAIFIVKQLQERYLAKERSLYFAFVDLDKAFDCVPHEVLCWQ